MITRSKSFQTTVYIVSMFAVIRTHSLICGTDKELYDLIPCFSNLVVEIYLFSFTRHLAAASTFLNMQRKLKVLVFTEFDRLKQGYQTFYIQRQRRGYPTVCAYFVKNKL